jgi:hypothetical protein
LVRVVFAGGAVAAASYFREGFPEAGEGVVDSGGRQENRKAKEPPAAEFFNEFARAAEVFTGLDSGMPWYRARYG